MKDHEFESLIEKVGAWSEANFGDQPSINPLLGVIEEVGEMAHAILKARQGIRGSKEDHIAELKDAIADAVIYAADYFYRAGEERPRLTIDQVYNSPMDITSGHVALKMAAIHVDTLVLEYTVENICALAAMLGWDGLRLAHEVFDKVVSKRDWKKGACDAHATS